MKTEPITMDQFITDAQQDLQERLSRMYPRTRVEQQKVRKVQGESYRGLMIRYDGHAASPVLNVEPFYGQLSFRTYGHVLDDLVQQAVNAIENPLNVVPEEIMDYDVMKDKLMTQVISADDNYERLEELPYREMKDMAVIYRFMLGKDARGSTMSVTVNNAMLETYGISREQLHADALAAMKEHHTFSIRPIGMVLSEMDPDFGESMGPPSLYVAALDTKMYGAAVITHPDFMENAAGVLEGDFFVIPSSVHEVLLLQDHGNTDYRELQELVESVNASMVDPSDKLTDNVYHYDASERLFETGEEYEDRMVAKELEMRPSVLKELEMQKQKSKEKASHHHRPPERSGAVL